MFIELLLQGEYLSSQYKEPAVAMPSGSEQYLRQLFPVKDPTNGKEGNRRRLIIESLDGSRVHDSPQDATSFVGVVEGR